MRIEYLYYYLDLVETVSISKTASNFYMTPQGLSRAIRSLEDEFCVTLVNRTSNAISISCAGQEFVNHARQIVDNYEKAKQSMRSYSMLSIDFSSPSVSVLATPFVFTYLFQLINDPIQQKASFFVKFSEANIYRLIPRVVKAEQPGTIGIISRPKLPYYEEYVNKALQENDLCYEPLLNMELQALVSDASPLAMKDKITTEDFKCYPVACFNDAVLIDALLAIIGKENITLITNSSEVLNQQLEQNQAISFVPAITEATGLPKNTVLKSFDNAYVIEVGFIANPPNYLNTYALEAIDLIRDYFEGLTHTTPFSGTYNMLAPHCV